MLYISYALCCCDGFSVKDADLAPHILKHIFVLRNLKNAVIFFESL